MKAIVLLCVLVLAASHPGSPRARQRVSHVPRRSTGSFRDLVIPREQVKIENCGMAPLAPPTTRLYGGREAPPHAYPWNVVIWMDHSYWCGGVLISDEWVLTTGGCVMGSGRIQVLFGAHNRDQWEESQLTYETEEYYVHESIDVPEIFDNDIAVIRLQQKVAFNDYIQPACLPTYTDAADMDNFVDVEVVGTAWGADTHGYHHALQYLVLHTMSTPQCAGVYGDVIKDWYLCTAGDRGVGGCDGDNGSPLNYERNGQTFVRGLTVFWSAAGCSAGDPTGWTRVSYHLDWISEKTGIIIEP